MRRLKSYNFLIISIFITAFASTSAIANKIYFSMQSAPVDIASIKPVAIGPNNVSGRCRALLFDNRDLSGNTVYLGAASGGLFKSTDGGYVWQLVSSVDSNLAVTSLTQDKDGYIYVGTGEDFTIGGHGTNGSYAGFMGGGIYRNKDKDADNFAVLPSTVPVRGNINDFFAFINRLASNPQKGYIYVATDKGFRYSADHGNTWQVLNAESSVALSGKIGWDIKATEDGTVCLVFDKQVYASATGENGTFKAATSGLPTPASGKVGRIEVAIAPSYTSFMYALVAKPNGQLDSVYRSVDRGATWTTIIKPSTTFSLFTTSPNARMGLYNNTIAVFPNDSSKILLGGGDLWQANESSPGKQYSFNQISITYDGGPNENLVAGNSFYIHKGIHAIAFNPKNPNIFIIGNDGGISVSALSKTIFVFNPVTRNVNSAQIFGLDAGVTGAVLAGSSGNSSLYFARESYFAAPQDAQTLLSFTTNSQTTDGVDAAISKFKMVKPFDRQYLFPAGSHAYIARTYDTKAWLYPVQGSSNSFVNGNMINEMSTCAFVAPMLLWETITNTSIPDSVTWTMTDTLFAGDRVTIQSKQNQYPFDYTLPFDVNMGDKIKVQSPVISRMFVGTTYSIWMTSNPMDPNAPYWVSLFDLNSTADTSAKITKMAISKDGNHLYFATSSSQLYRISGLLSGDRDSLAYSNAGRPTTIDSIKHFGGRVINSIAVDPRNPDNVIVTLGGYGYPDNVYQSNNATQASVTFNNIQGSLPAMPVYASLIEMSNNNVVFLGTENGLYVTDNANFTTNAAPTWTSIASASEKDRTGAVVETFPINTVPVFQLKQQILDIPEKNYVQRFLGTSDTSVFVHSGTSNWGVIYAASFGKGIFEISDYQKTSISDRPYQTAGKATLDIYPNPVSTNATAEFTLASQGNVTLKIYDVTGRVVKQLNVGHRNAGLNKFNFETSNLVKGAYTIEMNAPQQTATAKFIIVQ